MTTDGLTGRHKSIFSCKMKMRIVVSFEHLLFGKRSAMKGYRSEINMTPVHSKGIVLLSSPRVSLAKQQGQKRKKETGILFQLYTTQT